MTIENKLGIETSAELAREEERISKKKAVELFESGLLNRLEAGTFSTLKTIHRYLFEDIYDFAGELRKVNISKGNFRFAPLMYLEVALENIDKMPQLMRISRLCLCPKWRIISSKVLHPYFSPYGQCF